MTWPPEQHDDLEITAIICVGTRAAPISDANHVRPVTQEGSVIETVYWKMANGVTPVNALDGDIIWNADA